jgi:hypothetical protein
MLVTISDHFDSCDNVKTESDEASGAWKQRKKDCPSFGGVAER